MTTETDLWDNCLTCNEQDNPKGCLCSFCGECDTNLTIIAESDPKYTFLDPDKEFCDKCYVEWLKCCSFCGTTEHTHNVGYAGCRNYKNLLICERCDIDGDNYTGWDKCCN